MAPSTASAGRTLVYSDGACSGNPGPGGWAWASPTGRFACGPAAATTNQRMEVSAALEAVRANPGPLEVRSDSTYVVNCFRDRWWEGWLARGWTTSARKPVANRDLWEPLVALVRSRGDVRFSWVKGHSGDVWNDVADRLAIDALRRQQGRAGDELPAELGPPDLPAHGARHAAEGGRGGGGEVGGGGPVEGIAGHALVVVGLQEGDADSVRAQLAGLLADRRRSLVDHLGEERVVVVGAAGDGTASAVGLISGPERGAR